MRFVSSSSFHGISVSSESNGARRRRLHSRDEVLAQFIFPSSPSSRGGDGGGGGGDVRASYGALPAAASCRGDRWRFVPPQPPRVRRRQPRQQRFVLSVPRSWPKRHLPW